MATNKDVENGQNSVPLLQAAGNGGQVQPDSKEDRFMVYLSTFVAVCGSYAFGSCVSDEMLPYLARI